MTKEEKFLQLLYRTEEIRSRMINDVYQELKEIIPPTKCISSKNIVKATRQENLDFALKSISNFLQENSDYKKIVAEIYGESIEYVLYGYVFYLAYTNKRYSGMDIFKDKRSILYNEVSILDIL